MTARILNGKAAAAAVKDDLRGRVKALGERGVVPGLGTILVGDDPGSHAYVDGKHRDCAEVGIASIRRDLPSDTTQEHVEAVIAELNADDACHGYIVQLPLPRHLDAGRILELIDPDKDADGLHPVIWVGWSSASPPRCRAHRAASCTCCESALFRWMAPRSR